jgi:hypothetical protein
MMAVEDCIAEYKASLPWVDGPFDVEMYLGSGMTRGVYWVEGIGRALGVLQKHIKAEDAFKEVVFCYSPKLGESLKFVIEQWEVRYAAI